MKVKDRTKVVRKKDKVKLEFDQQDSFLYNSHHDEAEVKNFLGLSRKSSLDSSYDSGYNSYFDDY